MHSTQHIPVLLDEVLEWSDASSSKVFVDGTVGGGGHAAHLLSRLFPGGKLIGIDRDAAAIERARHRLEAASREIENGREDRRRPEENVDWFLFQGSYVELPLFLQELGLEKVDGIVLDLGLSSDQLADRDRGFSFREDSPLDLRFDVRSGWTAADLLQRLSEEAIADIIYRYGEERFSRRIAKSIVTIRKSEPIETTRQLADIVHRSVPGPSHGRIDKATRTFQALRIAVNEELQHLDEALQKLPSLLNPEGRLLIISFHSLEDRPVKTTFREHPDLVNRTKKPITASEAELARNSRSRSAKLRVASKRSEASSESD